MSQKRTPLVSIYLIGLLCLFHFRFVVLATTVVFPVVLRLSSFCSGTGGALVSVELDEDEKVISQLSLKSERNDSVDDSVSVVTRSLVGSVLNTEFSVLSLVKSSVRLISNILAADSLSAEVDALDQPVNRLKGTGSSIRLVNFCVENAVQTEGW